LAPVLNRDEPLVGLLVARVVAVHALDGEERCRE
jgi:hypothetical protein